jgi:hypothetical protein
MQAHLYALKRDAMTVVSRNCRVELQVTLVTLTVKLVKVEQRPREQRVLAPGFWNQRWRQ